MQPKGPFDLLYQNQFFNGWPLLEADPDTIVMVFPVEGWQGSAAVTLKQQKNGSIDIKVYGNVDQQAATAQALAAISLDEDGSDWPSIGKRDPIIGKLQERHHYMRPSLFNSPYEAAAAFIIGNRISIVQARRIRQRLAEEYGDKIAIGKETFFAFPSPQKLLEIQNFKSLNELKITRLKAVAEAALEGWLDRSYLRALDEQTALTKLESLPGVGPFFSQGILQRAVGLKDGLTRDDMTIHGIKELYKLKETASKEEILAVSDNWRPYRMWAIVLIHVWLRETKNFPKRTFAK